MFFDSLEIAMHSNNKLPNIKKMNYLSSYSTGEALTTVQDLKLSETNFSAAIEMLQEQFGGKQNLVSTHINKRLN